RESKDYIVQQIYLEYVKVAEIAICQYNDELLYELNSYVRMVKTSIRT
ncbi:6486_t:CDS:1, partial [Racocetra fulgida]